MGALVALLTTMFTTLMASFIARILIGAGLAFITYQALDGYVEGFLNQMSSNLSGLPGDMLALLTMAGVPSALEILGSAMMTVVAIKLTDRVMGVRLTGG